MKKILTISLDDEGNYSVKSDAGPGFIVDADELILNGKTIYDTFFKDQKIGEKCDLEVSLDVCFNEKGKSGKKRVAESIKKIFDAIAVEINKKAENSSDGTAPENDDNPTI